MRFVSVDGYPIVNRQVTQGNATNWLCVDLAAEVATAYLYLMENSYATGTVVVAGGSRALNRDLAARNISLDGYERPRHGEEQIFWPGLHRDVSITLFKGMPYVAIWDFQSRGTGQRF